MTPQRFPPLGARPAGPLSRRSLLRGALPAAAVALLAGRGAVRPRPLLAQRTPPPPVDAESVIREQVQAFMDENPTPGIAVAYYQRDHELFLNFGVADRATRLPISEDLVFTIGSVTKVFTATLIAAQIVDPAAMPPKALDDPVTMYLPADLRPRAAIRRVRLRDLATHTAGFPDQAPGVDDPADRLFMDQPPADDVIQFWNTWSPPAGQAIGSQYLYSNVGFVTLGYAAVGRAGPPDGPGYRDLLQQLITAPLGMSATAPQVAAGRTEVTGHLAHNGGLRPVDPHAADLKSTARDMMIWIKANLGVLDPSLPDVLANALQLTHVVQFSDPAMAMALALAWEIHNKEPRGLPPIYLKNGASSKAGQSCVVGFVPDKQLGVAVLTNADGDVNPTPLGHTILRLLAA